MREHSIFCPSCGAEVASIVVNPGSLPIYSIKYSVCRALPDKQGAVICVVCPGCGNDAIEIIGNKDATGGYKDEDR